jgi:hypothetical protein
MQSDFDAVRRVFAESIAGRLLAGVVAAVRAAWRTSATGRAARLIGTALSSASTADRLASIAIAVSIAAAAQVGLGRLMPRTVVPGLPAMVFVLIAAFAAGIAWQSEAIAAAWPQSRLARWIRATPLSDPTPPSRV